MNFILLCMLACSWMTEVNCPADDYQEIANAVLGIVLSESELEHYCKLHTEGNAEEVRSTFVRDLMSRQEFISNCYAQLRFELLQGTNLSDIVNTMTGFEQVKLQEDTTAFAQMEVDRLERLYFIEEDYAAGTVDLGDALIYLTDNYIYDQINMGIDNFVTTVFQYFTGRAPTLHEMEQSKLMCAGMDGALFFRSGNTKMDYLRIMTDNGNFKEFQVIAWYERLRLERPGLLEVSEIMKAAENHEDLGWIESVIYEIAMRM